ncbi:RNA polymerase III C11 subunit [Vermiconidia calcicola]|uniref:RNA polymerase III C11 subunit n=1 Tax=Vermiconidia calcicola TaxID=1690605 RepID=A0ACC3NV98_9PEZI|nr:RNA polymerase III C11 subunit [Vermiconidia calcicola]
MLIITRIPTHECAPEDLASSGQHRFECRTCPYQMVLDRRYYERKDFEFKKADSVLGGADSWKNVDKTEINCANGGCESQKAYFKQAQIRSADEPMTSFYRCVECGTEWREN